MSKSYGNVIPLLADRRTTTALVGRIVTDSRLPDEVKDPAACTVFAIYAALASPRRAAAMAERYRSARMSAPALIGHAVTASGSRPARPRCRCTG